MSGTAAEKAELRQRMRRIRAAIPAAERERMAARVEERLFGLPEVTGGGTVLLFYSFGSEIETSRMAERVHREGKRLLLPFLHEGTMEVAEVRPEDPLAETSYGPKEPVRRVTVDPAEVDTVIAPGLAFDRVGHRLGYGGGHYDRYLARLRPEALRVGIAFSPQLIERVPAGPGDQRLHLVVTDAGVVDCRTAL